MVEVGEPSGAALGRDFTYLPALDGLRGVAVAAVLLFHGERLLGGYLAIDTFFTLSGFLITSLLLSEIGATGTVALRAFWGRRFRRLFPALAVFVLGVAAYAAFVAGADELARLRRDTLSTLAYVANWDAIFQQQAYWDLFRVPSPLHHTWSLAIEEQFYLVWPLVVAGIAVVARRRHGVATAARTIVVGGALAAIGSTALMWWLYTPGGDVNRVYLGSDTRAASILLGAALAGVLVLRPFRAAGWTARRRVLEVAGVAAGVGLAVAWVRVGGDTPGIYRGGLLLCALGTAVVIASAAHPEIGVVGRIFAWRPLRWLGRVSYGVYLWHWLLYVALTPERVHLHGTALLAVQIAASVAAGTLSHHLVENPVRSGRFRFVPLRAAVPAGVALCCGAIVLGTIGAASPSGGGAAFAVAASAPRALPLAVEIPIAYRRVLIVGDSLANSIAGGASAVADRFAVSVANGAVNGCALTDEVTGLRLLAGGRVDDVQLNPPCLPAWEEMARSFAPDVVAVVAGTAAGFERFRLGDTWLGACDPAYGAWYRTRLEGALRTFAGGGAAVAVAILPYPEGEWLPADHRERIDCVNQHNREAARSVGAHTFDLGGLVCPKGGCIERIGEHLLRQDGVHFGQVKPDGSNTFSGPGSEFVAEFVLEQTATLRREGTTVPSTPPTTVPELVPDPITVGVIGR